MTGSNSKAKKAATQALLGMPGHRGKVAEARKAQVEEAERAAASLPPIPGATPPRFLQAKIRKTWRQLAPDLAKLQLLRQPDAVSFARYLQWLDKYVTIEKACDASAIVKTTSSKHVADMQRLDKSFQALAIIDKRLTDYEDRFGLNPKARTEIMLKLVAGHSPGAQVPAAPITTPQDDDSVPFASGPIGLLNTKSRPN